MSKQYRYLKKDEVIQAGDETDSSADGYNDSPVWVTVHPGNVGGLAPDPQYSSHRQYRRPTPTTGGNKMSNDDLPNWQQPADTRPKLDRSIPALLAEIKRLEALWLSEQKQRLDQFDLVKTYDAINCKLEIDELKEINAELLIALERIVEHQTAVAGNLAEFSGVVHIANNAIAKAKTKRRL